MQTSHNISSQLNYSFKDFLFKQKQNRIIILIITPIILLQFVIFKYFYPFASFINADSYSYIYAAEENLTINTYLTGYSQFLRLFSVFSKSDYALTLIQYVSIELSALFFAFTIFYFFKVSEKAKYLIIAFLVINPLFLHLANLVSSDCLFAAISFIWLGTSLWLIKQFSWFHLIIHSITIFLAFSTRYNGLAYPFLSLLMALFYMRKKRIIEKIAIILIFSVPTLVFVLKTGSEYKKLTGTWQYSPFIGWQWANNALYTFRYIDSTKRQPVPDRFKQLDDVVRTYFDNPVTKTSLFETIKASSFYMWSPGMPLYNYKDSVVFKGDTTTKELIKWATIAPLYKDYGIYIIRSYPKTYLTEFIIPNAVNYFAPPIEFLEAYNSGEKKIPKAVASWFNLSSTDVYTRYKKSTVTILNYFPALSGFVNMTQLIGLLILISLATNPLVREKGSFFIISGSFWLINAAFTIIASPAALRFQAFPIILSTITSIIILEVIIKIAFSKNNPKHNLTKAEIQTIQYV
ncbi:MAG: hypothetical protein DI539_16585 [Flavobacterium psychrophilum]|nr:MAG: hypothetical protein DI539_16585 [Flavobacterium psychrophilum]